MRRCASPRREEAGAAGAAMMAAVAIGAYPTMDACIADWVTPLLGPAEAPDPALVAPYDRLFPAYVAARARAGAGLGRAGRRPDGAATLNAEATWHPKEHRNDTRPG